MAEFKVPELPLRKALIGPSREHVSAKHEEVTSDVSKHEQKSEIKDLPIETSSLYSIEPQPPGAKLPYSEPLWSGLPQPGLYQLLVIKNGVEIDAIDLSGKTYSVCGRLPSCDIHLEHPSISRYHAVLQYRVESETTPLNETTAFSTVPREAGYYLYDLSSTHGTYLTKNKLQPRCYYRMRVGQSVKFGGSTRLFVLDQKSEASQVIVEIEAERERAGIVKKKAEYEEFLKKAEEEEQRKLKEQEDTGATWGMLMDDVADSVGKDDLDVPVDSEKEAYYINDPKKALKTFFDREGLELEYDTEETGPKHSRTYSIKVWLPIYTSTGEPVYAEASVKGNKKEAVVECALEACRLLDADGILRQSAAHSHKSRVNKMEDNDYYDSDEDNFFDRTGDVERKRKRRMIRAGKISESVETYESLVTKLSLVQRQMEKLQNQLARHREVTETSKGDSLEDYMKVVKGQLSKAKISNVKLNIQQLLNEEKKLLKLVKVAMPYQLPVRAELSSKNNEQNLLTSDGSTHVDYLNKPQKEKTVSTEEKIPTDEKVSADVDSSENKSYGLILPESNSNPPKEKRQKIMGPTLPRSVRKKIHDSSKVSNWDKDFDPEFASWIPPKDQTGDGRTKLNEKLGY